nr:hypothetical protein [Tanacetum cinerariifolium]
VDAHGVVLGSFFETGRHFKFKLVRHHAKDDGRIFMIMDVARRSRLGAWLRACCLFIIPSKFRINLYRAHYKPLFQLARLSLEVSMVQIGADSGKNHTASAVADSIKV